MIKEEQIIRSRRKSIALEIQSDGRLIVRAPLYSSAAEIDAFIAEKQKWIAERQALCKRSVNRADSVTAAPESRVPFLGAMLTLRYHAGRDVRLSSPEQFLADAESFRGGLADYDGTFLCLPHPRLRTKDISLIALPEEEILRQNRAMLTYWYREQARRILTEHTARFSKLTGFPCTRIRISSARTNWGSCNAKCGINYSLLLITLSLYEIDYVVVHELCHTLHRDHSPAFYREIEKTLPDYRRRTEAMKQDQWVLDILKQE
ncbi:MAG: M48 family metallopeptidase [Lachnospiraceae bacterium]|nr:M48 family metallopeptidase [Lachnospiraceae bacterium]